MTTATPTRSGATVPGQAQPAPTGSTAAGQRKAVLAAAVGNIVEWYDWTIYALFAVYFAEQFFPSTNEFAALLATFTVFAVGFGARPVGSILIGRISDRMGRKAALSTSVMMMAGASLLIAFLPSTETIGISAAIALVVLRLIQGLSLGGETAAVGAFLAESAPARKRGLFTSTYPTTIMFGTLLGSVVGLVITQTMSHAAVAEYGWRIPFFIGGLLGIVGFFIRRTAKETLDRKAKVDPHPIRTVFTKHRRSAFVVFLVIGSLGATFFSLIAGFPALAKLAGTGSDEIFGASIAGLIALVVLIPIAALISDRIGRKPVMLFGLFGTAIAVVPCVYLLMQGHTMASQLVIAVPTAAAQSTLMVSMIERFPANLRGAGFGFCFAISVALIGGTAPLIATALASAAALWIFPLYLAALCVLTGIVVACMRETAFAPLRK